MQQLPEFLKSLEGKNLLEKKFHQAVEEVLTSIYPTLQESDTYKRWNILERITTPDRVIIFSVPWVDHRGEVRVNRGYRVQFNAALGPYKGGLRFHPTVNVDTLKFLAFEQVFKNSLTDLMLGGGKGGSDFDPKGKTDIDVLSFCRAFMTELWHHIGADTDVPAGDIGVGAREIGYLAGRYRELTHLSDGTLTGKGSEWGGSVLRPEATGYGLVLFVEEMLSHVGKELAGKTVAISGSGNVAQHAAKLAIKRGAKVVTMSDSGGFVYDKNGLTAEKLNWIVELKQNRRGRIREYAQEFGEVEYFKGERPWRRFNYNIALPCATENEINKEDAETLAKNGCLLVAEGANMPSTPEAIAVFRKKDILFAPGKAANAGGVAVSGFEMAQDSARLQWSKERVFEELKSTMVDIHNKCVRHGTVGGGSVDYIKGANIAGFLRVADAMVAQGV